VRKLIKFKLNNILNVIIDFNDIILTNLRSNYKICKCENHCAQQKREFNL